MIQSRLVARPTVDRDRQSILLGAAAVGFVLSKLVQLPSQRFAVRVLGSSLGIELSTLWLITAFVVGLVVTGVHAILRTHPLCQQRQARPTFVLWILPALTALITGVLLAQAQTLSTWLLALVGGLVLLGLAVANEFHALDPAELGHAGVQLLVTVFIYALALAFLVVIYGTHARALVVAPAALVVCTLLAIRFFWNTSQQLRRVLLYGGVVGLVMAQAVWALNYLHLAPLPGGLFLLLVFYVATGLTQGYFQDQLNRRVLIEYGVIALVAIAAILLLF